MGSRFSRTRSATAPKLRPKHRNKLLASDDTTPTYSLKGLSVFAHCVKITDGDTIHATFSVKDTAPILRYTVRLAGYDSAELAGATPEECAAGLAAKEALYDLIMSKIIQLHIKGYDKYGRILAQVYIGEVNVTEWMIANGFGAPYNGRGEKIKYWLS